MIRCSYQMLDRAKKKALQSRCNFSIVALGFNKRGECVLIKINKTRFDRYGGGLHAEMVVMANAKKYGITKILICRVSKDGTIKKIDPCSRCAKVALKLNIKIDSLPPDNLQKDVVNEKNL